MGINKRLNLKERGWNESEIKKAENILERAEKHDVFFSRMVLWSAIIVVIFANLLISLILIPFLVVLNSWILYSIIAILGGVIGFLYNFLITDIGHLEKKHHILAGILVPIIALINIFIMILVSNKFTSNLTFVNNPEHNPLILSIIFAIALIIPYLLYKLKR